MSTNHAIQILKAAIKSVQPAVLISKHVSLADNILTVSDHTFDLDELDNILVIGAGKASAAMAAELERILGNKITAGFIVTKYEHSLPLNIIDCLEAGHPVPDQNSVLATKKMTAILENSSEKSLVICLISGGASALLTDPPPGSTLEDLQQLSRLLLESGATIHEINTVRKHLSLIKGGQLLRHTHKATVISLILSDVIGDPLDVIASGPTVPDTSTFTDAWNILDKYLLIKKIPVSIKNWLQSGMEGVHPDTPKQGDPLFNNVFNHLIGTNSVALQAASDKAKELGYHSSVITDRMMGEAKEKAVEFTENCLHYRGPLPACVLMGGETTVTLTGNGIGGRNQEFALAALSVLGKHPITAGKMPVILSAGTDGTDGPTEADGAFADEAVIIQAKKLGLDPELFLENNDSYHFFKNAGGHIITGPTQTNVMDIVIGLIPAQD
jgi:hydroxypyruvate reductase